jgi:hypothetical protein
MTGRVCLFLAALTAACSSSSDGHALHLTARLVAEDGQLAFLSPAATINRVPVAEVVGKPYYVAAYPAGFSPGNDPPLHDHWGTVGADLRVDFATPAELADGPYDMVIVVYVGTPISQAMLDGREGPPAAAGGDLASFTLSQSDVIEGDPALAAGTVRLNVAGGDASIELWNKTPADPEDSDQTLAAFDNTILIVP